MSHPVQDTHNGSVGQWLPLIEFSIRSGVSLSTIRRKIKSNSIPFKLEKGKYLVLFDGNGQAWDGARDLSSNQISPATSHLESQAIIGQQQLRIKQLEQELEEMSLLVQTLEQKYGVRY